MTNNVVRLAKEDDLELIAEINSAVFLGDRDKIHGARKWVRSWFCSFPIYQYFVTEINGTCVGYAGWQVHGGFHRAEPVFELDQIGVDPKHQGKGLATDLILSSMRQLVSWAKETNDRIESHVTFVVWAYALNFNAINVYAKFFTDGISGMRVQFGGRAENMLRVRIPVVRPVRDV